MRAAAFVDTLSALQSEVADQLGSTVSETVVHLAGSEREFKTLTQDRIPHWGIGVAYPQAKTIVLKYRPGQTASLLQTARHEFSHILLHHVLAESGNRVPVWFNEGVAMWVGREWRLHQSFDVALAVFRDGLIPLRDVDAVLAFGATRAQLAYDQSYLAVLFILSRAGDDAIPDLIAEVAEGTPFPVAIYRLTGLSPEVFESEFAAFVADRFGLGAVVTSGEAIWFYIVVLFLTVWVGVRRRNQRTFDRWEEEDPLEGLPLKLRAKINRERQ